MNTPINFEIAKLLKEKGFDRETLESYEYRGVEHQQPSYKGRLTKNKLLCDILAPTIAEVVMWLYEKHGIWIYIGCRQLEGQEEKTTFIPNGRFVPARTKNGFEIDPILYKSFSDPISAYQFAIEYTLKNLI